MELLEAMSVRKSIRSFRPDRVPRETLEAVLKAATRAPSGGNNQPAEIWVLGPDAVKKIGEANDKSFASGIEPHPDIPMKPQVGPYRERAIALARQLYGLMGIARDDAEGRREWSRYGLRFFGAPNAIILASDESVGERGGFECALLAAHICLAALEYQLGTCMQRQTVEFPENIRMVTGMPPSKRIAIGIAIGYPDWDHPANRVRSEREPLDRISTWLGFDQTE